LFCHILRRQDIANSSDHPKFQIIFRFFERASEKTGENRRKQEIATGNQKNLKKTG